MALTSFTSLSQSQGAGILSLLSAQNFIASYTFCPSRRE